MGRFPFYAYPSFPHGFYSSPAEDYMYRRPHHSFSPASSPVPPLAPTGPRSVINVPVLDSANSRSSPSLPPLAPAAVPPIDPSSAAAKIQSHFRGFCVRRHHPLLHLRSIGTAREQLEELRLELEKPEFSLKVRASEKDRLRFSESVMAIILRLDAIEAGAIAEVRSQRKEATKMAIKLQDAIDALMMQKNEIIALNSTIEESGVVTSNEGAVASSNAAVVMEQPQESLRSEVNMVRADTVSANQITDAGALQQKPVFSEDDVVEKCGSDFDNKDVTDMASENVSLSQPCGLEDLDQQQEAGSGCVKSVSHDQTGKAICKAEQDMSLIGKDAGDCDATQAAEKEIENAIDALHLETHKHHVENNFLAADVKQETCLDNMTDASAGSAELESTDGSCTCMDVVEQSKEGISQASEKHSFPRLQTHGNEDYSNEAHENRSNEANSNDEFKAQASTLSTAPSGQNNAILQQLSEDCRQLKSLVGKLVMQNKAQSNVLCALGERLELLEHQQRLNQRKVHEKRKLNKGSKRSIKYYDCE